MLLLRALAFEPVQYRAHVGPEGQIFLQGRIVHVYQDGKNIKDAINYQEALKETLLDWFVMTGSISAVRTQQSRSAQPPCW